MQRSRIFSILPLGLTAAVVSALNVVYVTDLQIFTSLAPCAASAISYNIQSQTYSNCPEAVTDLQSCVCTKGGRLAAISTAISSSVSYSCGSTASADQASAATVLSAYCNQATPVGFPTPSVLVSQYITDIAEVSYLAPCASNAVSEAVQSMTYSLCPVDATALATCACGKNQNSLLISQVINTSVKYSCSSHTADISSAQAVFSAYCGLLQGTSAFPTPSNPPGDMSYYITALPQYSSLAPCAASAVSYAVLSQTYDVCPGGPQALASCACIKASMSGSVSSSVVSSVKYYCSSTASEDVTSAISVLDIYCSAARNELKATGVTDSIAQTYATAKAGTGTGGHNPQATGAGNGGSSSSNSGGTPQKSGISVAVIAGAVAGVAALLIIAAAIAFFVVRNARRRRVAADDNAAGTPLDSMGNTPPDYNYKPELGGTMLAVPPQAGSPSPSTLKPNSPNRLDNVSPVSAHHSAWSPPSAGPDTKTGYPQVPNGAELPGQGPPYAGAGGGHSPGSPNRPELMSQSEGFAVPPANRAELMGQQRPGYGGYNSNGQQIYEFPAHARPTGAPRPQQPAEMSEMSWQSGPVTGYHELDGGGGGGGGGGYGIAR